MLLLLLRVPYAAAHMDLARDMFVAWRLLHGLELPLEGPVLNGMIHLGPVWYYLLAALQWFGRDWLGTMLLLGLLASLQIPAAYLLGKQLHSRRAGMIWAVGLLVPSWSTFEWMLPLHPLLSSLLVLAFVLCCARYRRHGARKYFYGMALAFGLALHAHPANIGCAWIGLFVLMRTPPAAVTWRDFMLAGLLVLAPLLPFLYADALRGFADLRATSAFATGLTANNGFGAAPGLLLAIVYGGTRYLLDPISGFGEQWARLLAAVVISGGLVGAVGSLLALRDPRSRSAALFVTGSLSATLLTVALMRDVTPYYMTTAPRVLIVGLVAIGLASLGDGGMQRALRAFAVAAALAACVVTTYADARFESRGAWPFAWWPLFDVQRAADATAPLMLVPAYAMDASGRFLCAERLPSIHGSYGTQIVHNYAMDMRLACGRVDVQVGGADSARSHWLGLSRDLLARIGVPPARHVGPIGLLRPRRLVSAEPPLLPFERPLYPAYSPAGGATTSHHLDVPIEPGEHLAISNFGALLNNEPRVTVTLGELPLAPVAQDRVTTIYACAQCAGGQPAVLHVDISTDDFRAVDVVTF